MAFVVVIKFGRLVVVVVVVVVELVVGLTGGFVSHS